MQFISSVSSSHPAIPVAVGEPSTSSACDQTANPSEQVLEEPENVKIASLPTSSPIETHDFGCQVNTPEESLMLKSVGIQTRDFFGLCDQYTQTEPGLFDGEAWFFNTEEVRVLKMYPLTKTYLISPLRVMKVLMMRRKKFQWQYHQS